MKAVQRKSGFTLAELLIVVAILAVLIAIMIPLINGQIEKANNAVDMSTMRAAYSEFMVEHIDGKVQTGTTYYYNPSGTDKFTPTSASAGYGKSKTSADKWWKGVGSATGTPKNKGKPAALRLKMDDAGNVNFHWGGGAYTGLNTTDAIEYAKLCNEGEKFKESQKKNDGKIINSVELNKALVEKDKVLLDSLQEEFQSMTYGQIKSLFYNNNTIGNFTTGQSNDNNKYLCVVIAKGEINKNTYEVPNTKNVIFLPEVFENAGYDTSAKNKYIINSIPGTDKACIWVNLGIKTNDLANLTESDPRWNMTAKNAYTYIKGKDWGDTANVLREAVRKENISKP